MLKMILDPMGGILYVATLLTDWTYLNLLTALQAYK